MKAQHFLIPILILSFNFYSQTLKFNRVYDLSPNVGIEWMNFDQLNDNDWDKFTNGFSSISMVDSSFHSKGAEEPKKVMPVAGLNFTIGLKKAAESEKKVFTPLLRFSLNSSSGFKSRKEYEKGMEYVYDSLIQSSNGSVDYLDSTITHTYIKNYTSKASNFSSTFLIQTNRNKIISYYLGLGLGFGIGRNSSATISLQEKIEIETIDGIESNVESDGDYDWDSDSYSAPYIYKNEYKLKNYTLFQFFVPIGIDFRLYNKDNFFGRSVLSLEGQFGANWMSLPEIGSIQNTYFRFSFAYKYRL